MSPVDIIIIVILLVTLLIGIIFGFIRLILSLTSWAVSLFIAWTFAEAGAVYLEPYISQPPLRVVAAFVAIFIVTLIVLSIISYLIYRLFAMAGISGIDRSLGAVLGIAMGVLVVSGLILGAAYMDMAGQPWWQGNKLVVHFAPVTDFLKSLMPTDIVANFPEVS